jgi:hypothetical protein
LFDIGGVCVSERIYLLFSQFGPASPIKLTSIGRYR